MIKLTISQYEMLTKFMDIEGIHAGRYVCIDEADLGDDPEAIEEQLFDAYISGDFNNSEKTILENLFNKIFQKISGSQPFL